MLRLCGYFDQSNGHSQLSCNAKLVPCSLTDNLCSDGFQGSQQNALIATVIVGLCNHFSTYISFWLADHYGRRFLLIE